jgi:Putative peptidoglycan binding domain
MKFVRGALGGRNVLLAVRSAARLFSLLVLETLLTISVSAQTRIAPAAAPVGSVHINSPAQNRANLGIQGLPNGPSQLPYPMRSTPANDAAVRNSAWAAYNANLHQIPTAPNPNRLASPQKLVDQDRLIQRPNSSGRYNFQFSDNEIRSVQRALRRMGTYSGQVDGILGPDTKRAIQEYQLRNKLPVTGQPDQGLNALLGIF